MTNSSYPADDATRIITGCAEVIFEIESAVDDFVHIDSIQAPTSAYPMDTSEVVKGGTGNPRRDGRQGLAAPEH